MKHRKLFAMVFALLLSVSLAGCGDDKDKKPNTPSDKPIETTKVAAKVNIDYLEKAEKKDLSNATTFIKPEVANSPYLTKLLVTTDKKITDIQFIEVEMGDATGEKIAYFTKKVIYEQDEMSKEKPLIFGTEFPGFTPTLLMTYKDEVGGKKIFSIGMSGEDNAIIVKPALLADTKADQPETKPTDQTKPKPSTKPSNVANADMRFVTSEEVAAMSNAVVYTDTNVTNQAYAVPMMLKSSQAIKNLTVYDITVSADANGNSTFLLNSTLYTLPELGANQPFIYNAEYPGVVPARLISYTLANGEQHSFMLSMSGKDGSLVSVPASLNN